MISGNFGSSGHGHPDPPASCGPEAAANLAGHAKDVKDSMLSVLAFRPGFG
jgi:hypothetical protein